MLKRLALTLGALMLAGCGTGLSPMPLSAELAGEVSARAHTWTERDVEFLTRTLAAEARGELKAYPASVAGVAYVMMRTARKEKVGVEALITKKQPWLLSSYKEGNKGINGRYFYALKKHQIGDYAALEAIARKALTGYDPTGIDANHFYDDSIAHRPPSWAKGKGVKVKRIGHFFFVHNPKDA